MKITKANFYKWHRILGLIALLPVIFWTISGLFHPFMSNWFRPLIPLETYNQPAQNKLSPVLSIQQIMDKNQITEIRNFGLVCFNKTTYYQILAKDSIYNYYAADNGKQLSDGDRQYAVYLARYFTQDTVSEIKSSVLQKNFDNYYQPINHLLPVWKISFKRPDGMDVYIETGQNRMGTFNNNTRKSFLWIFEQFHTWNFLKAIAGEKFRLAVLTTLVSIMLLSLLSGLTVYGLFWGKFKEIQHKRRLKGEKNKRFLHRYHRQIGLYISFILFMFIISAAFHLILKLKHSAPEKAQYSQLINRGQLGISNLKLPPADSSIKKMALASFNNQAWYQLTDSSNQISYYNTLTGNELKNGDQLYAQVLSDYYGNGSKNNHTSINRIGQFNNEYGFINKRLPVQQVSYPNGENWYIETTTAKLATKVAEIDRTEGLSFIFLHKFFWMSWAGKDIRDIVSMLAALTILIVSLLGFASFVKNK